MKRFLRGGALSLVEKYKNLSQSSGVDAYEITSDAIKIKFGGGDTYLYTESSVGIEALKKMKTYARRGKGLATYISQHIADKYKVKLKRLNYRSS